MSNVMNIDLIYKLFDAANMHRWNDHLRPIDLTEIDKQAHKAAIAWVLGKYEEQERGITLEWRIIVLVHEKDCIDRSEASIAPQDGG